MKLDKSLFDSADPKAEAEADARAEADAKAGRVISHGTVRRWLSSWGSEAPLPRPRRDD
jgi:predicted transcriptional regulator